jgi:hypothetical protein
MMLQVYTSPINLEATDQLRHLLDKLVRKSRKEGLYNEDGRKESVMKPVEHIRPKGIMSSMNQ